MRRHIGFVLLLAIASWVSWRSVEAAEGDRPLMQLVGSDVGACVEITGLNRAWPSVRASQVFQRFQHTPFYQRWASSDECRKFLEATRAIEMAADRPFEQLVNDLFGEHVVLAVYPVADGQPVGVLLMQATGPDELDHALSTWNRLEPCTIESREHAGHSYQHRVRTRAKEGEKHSQYYVKLGRLFALSDNEEAIRRVMDLAGTDASGGTPLVAVDAYRRAVGSLTIDHSVRVYLNFPAWDEAIRNEPEHDARFMAIWQQCESLIAACNLVDGPVLETVVHFRDEGLPPAWREAFERMAGPAEFLRKVPRNALAAFAGRHDLGGLKTLLLPEPSEQEQKRLDSFRQVSRGMLLGLDVFDDVLPRLSPNWGAYLVPREDLVAGALPVEGVVAFEIPAESSPDSIESPSGLRAGLDNGLKTALNLLAAWYNLQSPDESAILTSETTQTGTIWWIENLGAYRPAYGFTEKHLVFASSPGLIREFAVVDPANSLLALSAFQRNASNWFPGANQIFFCNVAVARSFLRAHWDVLLDHAVTSHAAAREDVERRMQHVDALLSLADSVFVAAEIDGRQLRLILGATVEPDEPDPEQLEKNARAPR